MAQGRGSKLAAALVAIAAVSLCVAGTASAGKKVDRFLGIDIGVEATNGYDFRLSAFRGQPGGASVVAQFENGPASVAYVVRKPALVSKRRIIADFGEIGTVDLRLRKVLDKGKDNQRCEHISFAYGIFGGHVDLEGETGYSRVRAGRAGGIRSTFVIRRGCGRDRRSAARPPIDPIFTRSRILATCGGESGAGFLAGEFEPGKESEFVAAKTERSPGLDVYRTISAEGATRRFDVGPGIRRAVVRPPEPFSGRAVYRDGELRGNIEVQLPGAGTVRLTPGEADLASLFDLEFPKCFPGFFGFSVGNADVVVVPSAGAAVAAAIRETALTPGARKLFGALGSG